MKLKMWQLDAFAEKPFEGNPAAVVPLEKFLPDATLQAIALENNLSETAFLVPAPAKGEGHYDLRWFTPAVEVDLCGHATLASAYVVFTHLTPKLARVTFHTKSGPLVVARDGGKLAMDLPAQVSKPLENLHFAAELSAALGAKILELHKANYLLAVLSSEREVRAVDPETLPGVLAMHGEPGAIVTAKAEAGAAYAIASRFFVPGKGILEDPVTGAAHAALAPFWSKRLDKKDFVARQVSPRGGTLWCTDAGARVILRGTCAPYLEGTIEI